MIKLLFALLLLLLLSAVGVSAGVYSLTFVTDSSHSPIHEISFVPGDSSTYDVQSNLDGNYQKVATSTAIKFSSDATDVYIYTYAKKSDWYSLSSPITTSPIATNSGRRSFKLRKQTEGTFNLTAEAPGYQPSTIPVIVLFSPLPPPPVVLPPPPPVVISPVAPVTVGPLEPSVVRTEPAEAVTVNIPTEPQPTITLEPDAPVSPIAVVLPQESPQVLGQSKVSDVPASFNFLDQFVSWFMKLLSDNIGL